MYRLYVPNFWVYLENWNKSGTSTRLKSLLKNGFKFAPKNDNRDGIERIFSQWHRWESLSLQIRDSHATQIRELRILRKREKNASMDWYIAWMRKESARFAKFASNKIELHALQRKARNLLIHRVVRERQKIEDRFSKIEERLRRQQNMVFEVLERFRDKTPRHLKLSNLLNQKIAWYTSNADCFLKWLYLTGVARKNIEMCKIFAYVNLQKVSTMSWL